MEKIRFGVFETNSSSTHTLTIVPQRVFNEWKCGDVYFNVDENKVETEEEAERLYGIVENRRKYYDTFEEYKEDNLFTYDRWKDDGSLETFIKEYTTESGDQIVIFGKYGHD